MMTCWHPHARLVASPVPKQAGVRTNKVVSEVISLTATARRAARRVPTRSARPRWRRGWPMG